MQPTLKWLKSDHKNKYLRDRMIKQMKQKYEKLMNLAKIIRKFLMLFLLLSISLKLF